MSDFELGTCTVPDGEKGPWRISTFKVEAHEAQMYNLRCIRDGWREGIVHPGTFKRLTHKERGVIMSNTRMEVLTNREAYVFAKGRVLINGLGLGMLLEAVLSKSTVDYVRVIELDQDVIDLVGPHFAHDHRVEIIQADAYEYTPAKGERFDFVWHDIWDTIEGENLDGMEKLARKYGRRCDEQLFWCKDRCQKIRREDKARRLTKQKEDRFLEALRG